MSQAVVILETALPVFLTIALGMLCRNKAMLSRDHIGALKNVVVNITLPAVLLQAFASAEYTAAAMIQPALVLALCCLALALGYGMAKLFRVKGRLVPFLATGFEAGMLGYALFAMLFPDDSVSHFALLDLGQTLFVFTLFKILVSGKKDLRAVGKDMLTSPILWAVAAGVLIGATGLYGKLSTWGVRGVLDSVTDFVGAPTAAVIMLTVGYDLVLREIPWKKVLGFVAMRIAAMAVFLGVIIGLNRTLLNGMIFEGAAVLLAMLPPPYVIPVFADEPDQRVQIASALSAMTLVSLLLFAAYSVLLHA